MKKLKEIRIETIKDIALDGYLLSDMAELNKLAHEFKGLTYLMNVMDYDTNVYMWFKNEQIDVNYFLKIH